MIWTVFFANAIAARRLICYDPVEMIGEPWLWGAVALGLSASLVALLKVTFWSKPDFRPSGDRPPQARIYNRLQEVTRIRVQKLQSLPIAEALRLPEDQTEIVVTRSGRQMTLRTRRTILTDGRIRFWVETADERWYSSALPVSEVIFLGQAPKASEPSAPDSTTPKK